MEEMNITISIDDLHPMGRRLKGRGGDQINAFYQGRGSLPATHLKNAPEGITHDAAHTGIQSWEVVHHAPDPAAPDALCPPLAGAHCGPDTAQGSPDVYTG